MTAGEPVIVMLRGKPTVAHIISLGDKTAWVRLRDGRCIKRHRQKHQLKSIGTPP